MGRNSQKMKNKVNEHCKVNNPAHGIYEVKLLTNKGKELIPGRGYQFTIDTRTNKVVNFKRIKLKISDFISIYVK